MDNKTKTKTRIAAIQLVSQQLVNDQDIESLKDDFDKHYRNTIIDNSSEKVLYNVNFLSKLVDYIKTTKLQKISEEINKLIKFDRKFEKWDTINKAIMFVAISEIINSNDLKSKIILNDYLEISKLFINLRDTKIINAFLDKFINRNII